MKNFLEKIFENIKSNYIYYLISLAIIIISVIIGFNFFKSLPLDSSAVSVVKEFMLWDGNNKDNNSLVFADAFKSNALMILAIWISGMTFIGAPIVITVLFIKGFSFGYTFAFITQLASEPGFYKIIITLVMQNIFIFLCLIVAAVFSIKLSTGIFRDRKNNNSNKEGLKSKIYKYAGNYILVLIFCFIEALFEGYIVPLIF